MYKTKLFLIITVDNPLQQTTNRLIQMKNTTFLDKKLVSRNASSSSMQRAMQCIPSGVAVGSTSVNVASTLIQMQSSCTQTHCNPVVSQPHLQRRSSSQQKSRIRLKHGKGSAIIVDLRDTLRISILFLASLCCFVICQSLVRMMNDETVVSRSRATRDESNQMQLQNLSTVATTSISFPSIVGKEPILQLLEEAGISNLDSGIVDRLPTWEEVT
jgi:hypothetical protein